MNILELQHVTKHYPGVVALDDVSLSFEKGEVHAIMGENGAGKSTLIKIIAGAEKADQCRWIIEGKELEQITPLSAKEHGIGVIYQEFNLVPSLSVAENIFLGSKVGNGIMPDFELMKRKAGEIFEGFGVDISPDEQVGNLSTAQQQIVEIAKAISKNVKVMIMDEPTSSLAMAEVERLFQIIDELKRKGVTILYISHRMEEVFRMADRVSILRDGRYIATHYIREIDRHTLIREMVGRELDESYPERDITVGTPVLIANSLTGNGDTNITFELHRGEILGFAGLVGSGRTELAKLICGAEKIDSGELIVHGKKMRFSSPSDAITEGIGLIPESRKTEGAFLDFPIDWNIAVMSLKKYSKHTVLQRNKIADLSRKFFERLEIKAPDMKCMVRSLSGGNQQKVVVAKVLAANNDIIIFDEPTRGIDVGAKQEIYKLMNELAAEGKSIIMISSEMEELLGMSDRIIVLHEGQIMGSLQKNEFSQNRIMELASGIREAKGNE